MNPGKWLGKRDLTGVNRHSNHTTISKNELNKYFTLREIEGISKQWLSLTKRELKQYLDFVNWRIDEDETLTYCKKLQKELSVSTYRKRVYQIRKYLTYLKIEWADNIKLPPEPEYYPIRVSYELIQKTLNYFKKHRYFKQIKAIILLGSNTGMRAEEIYQLSIDDIDIENRIVHINHNPINGQSTKTKRSRIAFFNEETKQTLSEYITFFSSDNHLKTLFSQTHISRLFKDAPIKVKDLRKYFSQEWDRRCGPSGPKKIIMGHSTKGDVDISHYNYQSSSDLQEIYNQIIGDLAIIHDENKPQITIKMT